MLWLRLAIVVVEAPILVGKDVALGLEGDSSGTSLKGDVMKIPVAESATMVDLPSNGLRMVPMTIGGDLGTESDLPLKTLASFEWAIVVEKGSSKVAKSY